MKSVIVSGATGGIGEAICREFANAGWLVGVGYHSRKEDGIRLANEIGGIAIRLDVTDFELSSQSIKSFFDKTGCIDALVNNAGVSLPIKLFLDTDDDEFDRVFSVNVKGVYNLSKAVVPYMMGKGGSIVNISSMWGSVGGSCEAIYSASKSAVNGLTKALAKELCSAKIRVNAVAPGFIDTEMNSHIVGEDRKLAIEEIQLGRVGLPNEVASAVLYLTEKATFTTGAILDVSGGQVI